MLNIVRAFILLSISLLFYIGCSNGVQSQSNSGKSKNIRSYTPRSIAEINRDIKEDEGKLVSLPASAELHHELGHLYNEKGDKEKSLMHFIRATEIEPYNTYYWNALGLNYFATQNYEEAKKCFLRMVAIEKFNSVGYYYLGLTLLNQGDAVSAEKNFVLAKTNLLQFAEGYQIKYGVPYDIKLLEEQINIRMKEIHELKGKK